MPYDVDVNGQIKAVGGVMLPNGTVAMKTIIVTPNGTLTGGVTNEEMRAAPLQVIVNKGGSVANVSGTAGTTASVLAAASEARKGMWVQNNSTSNLWINDVGVATVGGQSMKLAPGDYYEWPYIPAGAVSIVGETGSQNYAARSW